MNTRRCLFVFTLFLVLVSIGCQPKVDTVLPTFTPTIEPTVTPKPTHTSTPEPTYTTVPTATFTPTPIPGKVVLPITSMKDSPPWLEHAHDPNAMPGVMFYAFNTTKPPFDNKLVRQAFSAAVDREAVVEIVSQLQWSNVQPATTFIHPQVLGRNLYDEVGISFDPDLAKELILAAGYTDVNSFPEVTLVISASGGKAPGVYLKMAKAIVEMWEEHLGIEVKIRSIGYVGDLLGYLGTNPNGYDIYRLGFYTDLAEDMDPFLIEVFHSDTELNRGYNYAHFSNEKFEKILRDARYESDPETRQLLYIEAERILCEEEAALIPIYYWTMP